ncbi:TraR antiactivator (plasmid) [Neorhizobium sp. NCHU2750]|nr:TraR antiactivator [Neorhizobium sp. NCHU2750]
MNVTDKATLEALVIEKIRAHRRQIESDQLVYDEWVRASEDTTVSAMVLQAMQDAYLARQDKADRLQEELSELIDTLGYVPAVPEDENEQAVSTNPYP